MCLPCCSRCVRPRDLKRVIPVRESENSGAYNSVRPVNARVRPALSTRADFPLSPHAAVANRSRITDYSRSLCILFSARRTVPSHARQTFPNFCRLIFLPKIGIFTRRVFILAVASRHMDRGGDLGRRLSTVYVHRDLTARRYSNDN